MKLNRIIPAVLLLVTIFFGGVQHVFAAGLAGTRVDYPVGSNPIAVAFDNVTNSVWVANYVSNTVSKVNITTGTRTDYSVGAYPDGVAFDNVTNSVWVANMNSNTVSKVNITTGTRTDYSVGVLPGGVVFDNVTNSIWVANMGSDTVSKVNIFTGARIDYIVGNGPQNIVTIDADGNEVVVSVGSTPHDVAFDNVTNSVWAVNMISNTASKVNIFTGTKTEYSIGNGPWDIAFDNVTNSVWVTNLDNTVSKINITTGTRTDYVTGDYPYDIAFDNVTNSVWVANLYSNTVSKFDITTGTRNDYVTGAFPAGVAFDNVTNSVWVTNMYSGVVNKISTGGTAAVAPTVTTSSVTSVTQTTASSGGTVVSDGGTIVTVSGIAWSTALNPTTVDTKTTDGWAIGGPWPDSMTGLTANTTYHVRAYATNSVGTAYGADVPFTTSALTSCTLPWGGTIASGSSVTANQAPSVTAPATCTSQSRLCTNGTLAGTYTNQTCVVNPATSCTLPWGGSIASGNSTTAYQSASVMSPLACVSQSRACINGTLSGTYLNQNCSVIPAPCTLPWGEIIASGSSVTANQAPSVTSPATCTSESRLCTNGTLSGTYTNQTCVVNSVTACPNTVCEAGENPLTCPQDCRVKYKQF